MKNLFIPSSHEMYCTEFLLIITIILGKPLGEGCGEEGKEIRKILRSSG